MKHTLWSSSHQRRKQELFFCTTSSSATSNPKTWTKSSPLLKTQLTDLTDYPQNANVGRSSSNLILALQTILPPSLPPFLFKTVAPPQSSNNIPPNTNTKPKQNQTHSLFLPPSPPPQHKASTKTAIFGLYSTHPTTTTTTKVITNTTTPATTTTPTNKQTNKQTITTPTTIPSPHYNCNLLPLLKTKCRQAPKCDGGIFEFLKKQKSFPESKTFLQSPKPSSSSSSSSSQLLLQRKKIFFKIFFFGGKEKKNFFFFLQSHKGRGPNFPSFLPSFLGAKKKRKKNAFG